MVAGHKCRPAINGSIPGVVGGGRRRPPDAHPDDPPLDAMKVALLSAAGGAERRDAAGRRSLQLLRLLVPFHEVAWVVPTAGLAAAEALPAPVRAVPYEPGRHPWAPWSSLLARGREPDGVGPGALPGLLLDLVEGADLVVLDGDWCHSPLNGSGPPLLVDLLDSAAHDFSRRAALTRGRASRRWLRRSLAAETRQLELLETARGGLAVSARAGASLAAPTGNGRRRPLWVVPQPQEVEPGARRGGRGDALERHSPLLVLAGALDSFPARDGIAWWLARVWPLLSSRRPEIRLAVHGDGPPDRRLARRIVEAGGRIVRSGGLDELLARATLAIEPARCGLGASPLILQAWACGVPVVASSWAAAGTTGRRGIDLRVADAPEVWVRALLELLEDRVSRERFAASAAERLRCDYDPQRLAGRLAEAVTTAAQRSTQ